MDLLDTIIGLGPNLFYGAGLSACLLILRASKSEERLGKIMFVDAFSIYKKGRAQNELQFEHVDKIYELAISNTSIQGYSRLVSLDEIAENDFNLNIARYIEPIQQEETLTFSEAIKGLKFSLNEAFKAEQHLKELMIKEGFLNG